MRLLYLARYISIGLSILILLAACEQWGDYLTDTDFTVGTNDPATSMEDISLSRQALSSNPPDSNCTFDTQNGHEYWFCRNDRDWQQARTNCLAAGGDLAVIESAAENDYIRSALDESSWIGATDEGIEGQWLWAKSGEQFWSGGFTGHTVNDSFEKWAFFQPSSPDCALIKSFDGTWEAKSCGYNYGYVCELDEVDPLSAPESGCVFVIDDGHKYWFCENDRKWQEARDRCTAIAGDLVTIDDQVENEFVYSNMMRMNGFCGFEQAWIGANDIDDEGEWIWASSGEQFWSGGSYGSPVGDLYSNWEPWQPGYDDCARMTIINENWEVDKCTDKNPYICELEQVPDQSAPESDSTLGTFDGVKYYFCENERTFDDARQRCQSVGADLVTIESAQEDDWLMNFIDEQAWIGASDQAVDGDWKWLWNDQLFWSNGAAVSNAYTHWEVGYPWGSSHDCASKDPYWAPSGIGGWENYSCDFKMAYICEMNLTRDITVSKTEVCPGENIRVQVAVNSPTASVIIGDAPGADQELQLRGRPGPRRIPVFVQDGDLQELRSLSIEVKDCGSEVFPLIVASYSLNDPYTVELLIGNASDLTGADRQFQWDFGDGSTTTTPYPFIRHSYADAMDADTVDLGFDVSVGVQRTGLPDVVGVRTIVVHNLYAANKKRGVWQPPAFYESDMIEDEGNFVGLFSIRNYEPESIRYTSLEIETRPCDTNLDSIVTESATLNVVLGPYEQRDLKLTTSTYRYDSSVCGLAVHLSGMAPNGEMLHTSLYYDLPHERFWSTPVVDQDVIDLLNDVSAQGLTSNPNHIRSEELTELFYQGRISFLPDRMSVASSTPELPNLPPASDPIGQRCEPEDTPPRIGITCQVTDEWTTSPPIIRNGYKGDVIAVSACGPVGKMLKSVTPSQNYSHVGMMTRNYDSLSHSTCSIEFIEWDLKENRMPWDPTFRERYLKYCWPGIVHDSIDTAFYGNLMTSPDPEDRPRIVRAFKPSVATCDSGRAVPPLVVRPVPGENAATRGLLHDAADIALQASGHYRFYVFTDANIIDDPSWYPSPSESPWGTRPGVCSAFVWDVLRQAGATLEGSEAVCGSNPEACLEPIDLARRADVDPSSVDHPGQYVDGLYFYSEEERLKAGRTINDHIYNKVLDSGFILFTIWEANELADQVTNCFAVDYCTPPEGEDQLYWRTPGPGQSVSPDDIIYSWDGPDTGGVYGYSEPLSFSDADFRLVHRWAVSEGTGELEGRVELDGSPVLDGTARAELLAPCSSPNCSPEALLDATTDSTGSFHFDAVPEGTYLVRALLPIDSDNDGIIDQTLVNSESVTIVANSSTYVVLELRSPNIPQPQEMTWRKVRLSGHLKLHDYDWPDANDVEEFDLPELICDVSPLKRIDWVQWGQDVELCKDEVWATIIAKCELLDNDEDVKVTTIQVLYEEDDCGDEDLDGVEKLEFERIVPGASASGRVTTKSVEDPDDYARLDLTAVNDVGRTVTADPTAHVDWVTIQGEVHIKDVEFAADDEERMQLWTVSVEVDSDSHALHSFCVGAEVIAMIHAACWESMGDIYCDITYYLYEGDDCMISSGDDSKIETESFSMPYGTADGLGYGIGAYKGLSISGDGSVDFRFRVFKNLSGGSP
jgi:hypothetical protein